MSKAASHAMAEAATAEMADIYDAVVETHAVIDDVPPGTHAMAEAVAKFQPGKCRIGRQPVAIRRMQTVDNPMAVAKLTAALDGEPVGTIIYNAEIRRGDVV